MKTIVELSIKAYEQNEVYEILNKINNAKKEDITKLAIVFKKWGIKEIADILTLVQQRLQIIDAFETIINDDKTLELQGTHKFLADNMWIIDERYEWFYSNKTLSTISHEILDSRYKGQNKDKRPDLFIKISQGTILRDEYLILELKKPKNDITFEDKAQGERYAQVISQKCTKPSYFNVYIVGSNYETGIQRETLAGNVRTIAISYHELVNEAKIRMQYIYENLKENEEYIQKELYSFDKDL
jgi:hypothetical protein